MGALSMEGFPQVETGRPGFHEAKKPRRRPRGIARAGLALALATALVACNGGDDDSASPTTDRSTTTSTVGETTTTSTAEARPTTTAVAACAETQGWNTDAQSSNAGSQADLYNVRSGHHPCYDRIAFDVNEVLPGDAEVGYDVRYVQGEVAADASGEPVPTFGDFALQVVVRAPALGYNPNSGHQPGRRLSPGVGADVLTATQLLDTGVDAVNEVAFAGSFEGQTTFAVGLDERLPFRAGVQEYSDHTVVYVDVANS